MIYTVRMRDVVCDSKLGCVVKMRYFSKNKITDEHFDSSVICISVNYTILIIPL